MKRALLLLLLPALVHAAKHDHSAHAPGGPFTPEPTTQEVHDHSARVSGGPVKPEPAMQAAADDSPAMQEARHMNLMMHGDSINFLLLGERFEQAEDDGVTSRLWEAQGWVGGDRDKFWVKTEGHYDADAGSTERSEVQALYSRAVAPFWDVQAGLRRNDSGSASRHYAVLGLQGLAPYWFELDAAAFINEKGELSARFEAEYELRFTQKLLLQPRLELNYSFGDDPALGIGEGLSEAGFGLRLRYEFRREFAPYVGVEWSQAFGGTAALLGAAGREREEVNVVAGLRFWY